MKKLINISYSKLLLVLVVSVLGASCSKDEPVATENQVPGVANLVLPKDNTECEVGDVVANMAEVQFQWDEATNADKYDLVITNLVNQEVTQRPNLTKTSISVRLERGFPYSWKVISKNSGEETTTSDAFKFYVAGEAGANNAPFPATLKSPASGAQVSPVDGKVTLKWEGDLKDSDGDPVTFTVFADTIDGNQEPPQDWKALTDTIKKIDVVPNKVYYWHVETSDGNNTAISTTYTFKTGENTSSIVGKVVNSSQEILDALAAAVPGENIYVHGGNYTFDSTIEIKTSGSEGNTISLLAYPGDDSRPKFDFSSMTENSSNRGIELKANFWHFKGIDVYNAGDNGMHITGSNNVIEFCTFSECSDTGLQIDNGASNNTILNCDSYFNADSSLENADGFAAKLDVGSGNKFIGCRAWQNLDDGWDGYLKNTDNVSTYYENCWSVMNGYLKDGTKSGGDGNGFKTGGSDNKDLKHNATYVRCIAAGNFANGFDHNSNRGDVTLYNCSAYDNGKKNYSFGSTNQVGKLTIKNSDVLGDAGSFNADVTDISNNSWMDGINASVDDFESLDYTELLAPRKADGSLPDVSFFHLDSGSDLIDKGIDVGLPYNGAAPDLGAFEH